jgi:hypothetical protein
MKGIDMVNRAFHILAARKGTQKEITAKNCSQGHTPMGLFSPTRPYPLLFTTFFECHHTISRLFHQLNQGTHDLVISGNALMHTTRNMLYYSLKLIKLKVKIAHHRDIAWTLKILQLLYLKLNPFSKHNFLFYFLQYWGLKSGPTP